MQYDLQELINEVVDLEKEIIKTMKKDLIIKYLNTYMKIKNISEQLEVALIKDFLKYNDLNQFRMTGNLDNMVSIIIAERRPEPIRTYAKDYKKIKILLARMYKFLETLPDNFLSVNVIDLDS